MVCIKIQRAGKIQCKIFLYIHQQILVKICNRTWNNITTEKATFLKVQNTHTHTHTHIYFSH